MKEKIFTKNFIFTFFSLFCSAMVMYVLMATMAEYASSMGATATVAGLVSGIYIFGGLCARICSGAALEKIGWKRFAVGTMILHFLACCCYFFADTVTALITIRFIHGLGFGASANGIMTMGMAFLPKSRYGEAVGYFLMAPSLAIAVGPYLGGMIYDMFGSAGSFAAAAVLSLLMPVLISAVDTGGYEPKPNNAVKTEDGLAGQTSKPAGLDRLLEVSALPVSLSMFLCAFGYIAVISFYRMYSVEKGLEDEFSRVFLYYGIALILSRLVVGRIQDRFGDNIICISGLLAQCAGLICIAIYPCTATIIICAIGCALGFGTLNSACNVIVCRNVSDERRPYAVTSFWVGCDGGAGIGPFVLGAVVTAAGFQIMYFTAALITLAALPVYYISHGRKVRKYEQT